MNRVVYRYTFSHDVSPENSENFLVRSMLAIEALHGEAQVRLDAAHYFDVDQRACVIDASTPVGRDLNKLFVGFLSREFGEESFRVERVDRVHEGAER